jgi:hypothetical protein
VVLEATITDANGKELGTAKRTFMPQAGDGLGERMRVGAENKLGLLRDSSLQPLTIRREVLEFELPPDMKEITCRLTARYELRPDNTLTLHEREFKLRLRE